MLKAREAIANVAVRDLGAAKRFYEGTLGLTPVDAEDGEVVVYAAGASKLLVYHSQFAGTNKATAVTWPVGDDLDREVETLKAKGVAFEHYDDMPDTKREGDVHVSGARRVASFKDPDGNIHNLVNQ